MKVKLKQSVLWMLILLLTACGGGGSDSSSNGGKVSCLRSSGDSAGNINFTNTCDFRVEVAFFDNSFNDTNDRFSVAAGEVLSFNRNQVPRGSPTNQCRSPLVPRNTGNGTFVCV